MSQIRLVTIYHETVDFVIRAFPLVSISCLESRAEKSMTKRSSVESSDTFFIKFQSLLWFALEDFSACVAKKYVVWLPSFPAILAIDSVSLFQSHVLSLVPRTCVSLYCVSSIQNYVQTFTNKKKIHFKPSTSTSCCSFIWKFNLEKVRPQISHNYL